MNKVSKLIWNTSRQHDIDSLRKAQSKRKTFLINIITTGITAAMISPIYANCSKNDQINQSCSTTHSSTLFNTDTANYIQSFSSISTRGRSIHLSQNSDVTNNSGNGYEYTSATDTDSLIFGQTAGKITGSTSGLNLVHQGTNTLSINTAGTILGSTDYGIVAENAENSTDIIITQLTNGSITGGKTGILVVNNGKSTTNVNTSGAVNGNQEDGISVINGNQATDISINNAKPEGVITGGNRGINVDNQGIGNTEILVSGSVKGVNGEGIFVKNSNQSKIITINQLEEKSIISGNTYGISVYNSGSEKTSILSKGKVIGSNSDAIYSETAETGSDVFITQFEQSEITGHNNGITVINKGRGESTFNLSGKIIGEQQDGIVVQNLNPDSTKLSITQGGGSIWGNVNGLNLLNKGKGATTITTRNGVEGQQKDGIIAINETGSDLLKLDQTSGSIKGHNNGLNFVNKGNSSIIMNISGDVTGQQEDGIKAINQEESATNINLTQSIGYIRGHNNGINVINNGRGSTQIDLSSYILSYQNDGVSITNGNTANSLTINQYNGTITGNGKGINLKNNGKGTTNIGLSGTVSANTNEAVFAENGNQTDELNFIQSGGSINGKTNGVYLINNGLASTYIETSSVIVGDSQHALLVVNNDTTNDLNIKQSDGSITGFYNGINALNNGQGLTDIEIAGEVNGYNAEAILINNGLKTRLLKFTVTQSGDIKGHSKGVNLINNGEGSSTLVLNGKINSTLDDAIDVSNQNNTTGIDLTQSTDSIIQGANNGIKLNNSGKGNVVIVTSGIVVGKAKAGIEVDNGTTSSGVSIKQNQGAIHGRDNGIYVNNNGTDNTVIDIANKVYADGNDQNNNKDAGIYTTGQSGTATYINLNNGANVYSTLGTAIRNEVTNSTINLNDGSKVSGKILLGTGNDTLNINQGADISDITVLDGGHKATRDGDLSEKDVLNFSTHLTGSSDSTGSINNVAILDWENINVGQTGILSLTGDLNTDKLTLSSGSVLDLVPSLHQATVRGSVYNAGTITLNNGFAGDNLTITGDYHGENGRLLLDTVVQDSNSPTDKLFIGGNASGHTSVNINNVGGLGANTGMTNGIEIVNVKGISSNDAFNLEGNHLDVGAFEYYLYKGGLNQENENWYLRSYKPTSPTDPDKPVNPTNPDKPVNPTNPDKPVNPTDPDKPVNPTNPDKPVNPTNPDKPVNPTNPDKPVNPTNPDKPVNHKLTYRKEVPMFAAVAAQLRQADLIMQGNMHQRIGNTLLPDDYTSWGRLIAARSDIKQDGDVDARSKGNYTGLQVGSDVWLSEDTNWRAGGYFGYLYGRLHMNGFASGDYNQVGKNNLNSYFIGAYGNYMQNDGTYLDLVLQGGRHEVDIKPDENKNSSQKGYGISASIEAGKPFNLNYYDWKLEPQAQIIHQWLNINNSHISGQTTVKQDDNDSWLFRVGARLENNFQTDLGTLRPYTRVNLFYSPDGDDHTIFASPSASTKIKSGAGYTSTELAIGGSYEINSQISAYTEIGHTWSNSGDANVKAPITGSLGLRANW
ncbi:autotransporter outer membrane beta-barrel domain-containing protein [Gilliamella sp. wkB171]|uniref:autotransporter outer membrane beta-barrel domain-containing protein n=1 Tax=Gilliamella sp. wkB171 TaxID=3120258 RepID=UPI000812ECAB|nr:autotransporter outer membrane beta-barrel domain-containing protein [Gilliamella apicola]OCL19154.1 hypothetical protein A9G03_09315 [Gilliamella apicola]